MLFLYRFINLPRIGKMPCILGSRASTSPPAAESPSEMKSSHAALSLLLASTNFVGKARSLFFFSFLSALAASLAFFAASLAFRALTAL